MGLSEGEERKEEIIEAITTENFPKLMIDTKPHFQEPQRTSKKGEYTKKLYT